MPIEIKKIPNGNNNPASSSGDVWTKQLTNDSIEISKLSSVKYVSIKNISAVAGSITGNFNSVETGPSDVLSIAQDEVISLGTDFIFNGLSIQAPVGCTLHIIIGF